jgi:membrane-bound metal-dependent hydrolase YbcI (DUF457 family)
MNRQTHIVIGVVLFLIYLYLTGFFHSPSGELFVFGIFAVAAGSICPDILEPATSAQHRRFFHSWRTLKFVAVFFLITAIPVLFALSVPHFPLVFSGSCFFLGYSAHLLADSTTRAGLPR